MRFASVPYGELPGVSALFAAYTSSFDRAARFYRHDPFSLAGWLEAAREALSAPGAPRREVVEALRSVNPQCGALERLLDPGAVAVVTGQQAGLFGGPAYTLYKALTAVHVARRLEAAGQPAVPVFWVASEDQDLEEVSHAHVFDTRVRPLRLDAGAGEGRGRPVGTVPIPQPPLAELAGAFEGFLHAEEVMAMVREAYQPGKTFSESFRSLLGALLRPYGMVFVDPLEPRLRRLAAPLLEKAWEQRNALGEALAARRRELEQAGFHAQVEVTDGAGLFFVLDGGVRRRAGGGPGAVVAECSAAPSDAGLAAADRGVCGGSGGGGVLRAIRGSVRAAAGQDAGGAAAGRVHADRWPDAEAHGAL